MENASKAIIMAGSILIAVIIISLLVMFFQNLRGLAQTEKTLTIAEQAEEYNKPYEAYNRNIYGSEILSIANKIEDYNKKQAEIEDYTPIELIVTINQSIDNDYFKAGKYYVSQSKGNELQDELERIETDMETIGNVSVKSRKIYQLASMRTKEMEDLGISVNSNIDELRMTVQQAINKYNSLKSTITQIKSKIFKLEGFDYDDNTGRITKMRYKL